MLLYIVYVQQWNGYDEVMVFCSFYILQRFHYCYACKLPLCRSEERFRQSTLLSPRNIKLKFFIFDWVWTHFRSSLYSRCNLARWRLGAATRYREVYSDLVKPFHRINQNTKFLSSTLCPIRFSQSKCTVLQPLFQRLDMKLANFEQCNWTASPSLCFCLRLSALMTVSLPNQVALPRLIACSMRVSSRRALTLNQSDDTAIKMM